MTPTSPITPRPGTNEEVELYEQDNMSKSSLTMQQELEQAGKLGLHLIEELKAKNQIIEDLAYRLRMIYSSPNTPDLTVGGSHEFLSNSFLSSIRGPGSSRTVSPVLPSGMLNECMDRAEKEIVRLEDQVLTQTREIEALRQDLATASDLLSGERERFKDDRVKLKKEIMELQVVLKRKDQFASSAILKAKDRLSSTSCGVQADLNSPVRPAVKSQGISVDFGDFSELVELRQTLESLLSKTSVSAVSQTDDQPPSIPLETHNAKLAELTKLLAKETQSISVGTERTIAQSSGTNTESVRVFSTGAGEEIAKRFTEESIQTVPLDDLVEENRKLKEKYLRYRSEFAAVVEKRKAAIPVGTNTEDPVSYSQGTTTETITFDRGTSRTPQMVSDSVVQVDDDRDEKLFLAESDVTMLAEDREALILERERIVAELFRVTEERDRALVMLNSGGERKEKNVSIGIATNPCIEVFAPESYMGDESRNKELVSTCATGCGTIPPDIVSTACETISANVVTTGCGTITADILSTACGTIPVDIVTTACGTMPADILSTGCGTMAIPKTESYACGTERMNLKTTGTDPVEFVVADVIQQLSSEIAVGDVSMASYTVEQSTLVLGPGFETRDIGVSADDDSYNKIIESLRNEIALLKRNPVVTDMSTLTVAQEEYAPTPLLDISDLSPTSLAVKLDDYMARGSSAISAENQLIRSLQKRLLAAEKTMKEKSDFFKSELDKLRQAEASMKAPVSPLPKLLSGDKPRDTSSYFHPGGASPPEFDLSEIAKPVPSQTTTLEGCSPGAATFDFSISQQTLVSSLSPLRIPFATPVSKDTDGDVIMNTAPKTQIRNEFAIHQDVVAPIAEEPSSLFESAGAENAATLQAKNGELMERMRSVRNKAMQIKNMTNRLWSLTGSI